jgi:hypothetical protein
VALHSDVFMHQTVGNQQSSQFTIRPPIIAQYQTETEKWRKMNKIYC